MRIHLRNICLQFALFCSLLLSGQVRISSEEELGLLKETPMEALYLHTPGTLYMPGEYLYYSVYCVNMQNYKLSELSEVAYVQLISEDNIVVFTQKIDIEDGRGQGDFFFPTDLPSGNYKLVAYTHWMKNAGISQFFRADLTFINPYRADQNVFLNPGDIRERTPIEGSDVAGRGSGTGTKDLGLEVDKAVYAMGEVVTLQVRNFRGVRGYGTYSLSVRKTDDLPGPRPVTAENYGNAYSGLLKRIPQRVNDILAVPEQRGELISGRITNPAGEALSGRSIAVSLPGSDFQVKKVRTDEEGKFYTYLTRAYNERTGMAEVLSPGPEEANVKFDWYSPYTFEDELSGFYQFELQRDMAEAIRKRSIHNQIENNYFEVKPDTLIFNETSDPFEGELPQVYELEDYTRFKTLRETIIEYIEYVWIKKDDDGTDTFYVREPMSREGTYYTTDPPLVVVDGILLPDRKSMLGYDARKIKTIKVLRNKYQLGGQNYQGMVAIETIDNTYLENWDSEYGSRFSFLPASPRKNYFRQISYSDTIPDFRYQLLWEPHISIQGVGNTYSFYTSQVPGTYEVRLEGFTTFGKPISLTTSFQVESP